MTKFSLNQKVKAIAAPYNGQIGTVIDIDPTYSRLNRVKFPDGVRWRYDDSEIEAVQETSRPKVGDTVIFERPFVYAGKQYQGKIGIVEKDDGSGIQFYVRISLDFAAWFKPTEISLALKQHQIFAKLKPGMRVHTSRNGWFIAMPSCMATIKTDCEFVLWNTEGCCGNKEAVLDELKYTKTVYTAPSRFHDAHVPYKHGGECVWDVSEYVEAQKQRHMQRIKKQIAELEKQLTSIK